MILQVQDLFKSFTAPNNDDRVDVLTGINFDIQQGETVAILGQSGSGKSTFLSLMAGLDHPTEGSIRLNDQVLSELSEEQLARFRSQNIGIIFQQFHLMSHLNALENVSLPLELIHDAEAISKAQEALDQVGLGHRATHFPHQLSGGECQRVAIARALVVRPALLLADEPSGNLDTKTGDHIADLLFELVESTGMTMLLVTHNEHLAQRCGRSHFLKGGKLV